MKCIFCQSHDEMGVTIKGSHYSIHKCLICRSIFNTHQRGIYQVIISWLVNDKLYQAYINLDNNTYYIALEEQLVQEVRSLDWIFPQIIPNIVIRHNNLMVFL